MRSSSSLPPSREIEQKTKRMREIRARFELEIWELGILRIERCAGGVVFIERGRGEIAVGKWAQV